jgi:hypothetical protein
VWGFGVFGYTVPKMMNSNAATQKQIADLDLKMQVGFARTDEKMNTIDQRLDGMEQRIGDLDKSWNKRIDSLEQRSNGQETRFWSLVGIIGTALLGILAKVAFFPTKIL